MRILSLFGGIEAGRVALDVLGITPEKYFSAEFDKYPSKVAAENYPSITHIGSVTEVRYSDGRLETANGSFETTIDWLIGGPPCQDLSIAGKRAGLEGSRSSLFWEYVRILNEIKPKFFLVENVASMPKDAKETMTEALFGIEPVLINSALVSAQNRKRLFWVGKRNEDGTYSKVEISQPEDRGIVLKDILEPIPLTDERWKPLDEKYVGKVKERIKSFGITATYAGACPRDDFEKSNRTVVVGLAHRNRGEGKEPECNGMEKANSITSVQSDSEVLAVSEEPKYYWRKLTVRECARLQTFPETYSFDSVSASRAYKGIGNSWTVEVIAHIFKSMLGEIQS